MTRRAFTVVEVLLAMALVAVTSAAVFGFIDNLARIKDATRDAADRLDKLTTLLDRLEDDLAAAIAGGTGLPAGIQGRPTSITLLTRGVGIPASTPIDRAAIADLRQAVYAFDRVAGVITARRGPIAGIGTAAVAVRRVRHVRFRFHDGSSWSETFDSGQAGGLPVAVEVAVWLGEPERQADDPGVGQPEASAPSRTDASFSDIDDPPADDEASEFLRSLPAPDRLRLIAVPDGPVSAWKEGGR